MATTATPGLLVADDDRNSRRLYRAWFDGEYDVQTAADGAEALEQLDDSIDAVVLDREMPRVDGVAVASEIRSGPPRPGGRHGQRRRTGS